MSRLELMTQNGIPIVSPNTIRELVRLRDTRPELSTQQNIRVNNTLQHSDQAFATLLHNTAKQWKQDNIRELALANAFFVYVVMERQLEIIWESCCTRNTQEALTLYVLLQKIMLVTSQEDQNQPYARETAMPIIGKKLAITCTAGYKDDQYRFRSGVLVQAQQENPALRDFIIRGTRPEDLQSRSPMFLDSMCLMYAGLHGAFNIAWSLNNKEVNRLRTYVREQAMPKQNKQ